MNKKFLLLFFLLTLFPFIFIRGASIHTVALPIKLDDSKAIFKDNIRVSCDSPKVIIKSWKIKTEPVIEFISSFRKNKKLFNQDFKIELELEFRDEKAKLFCSCFVLDLYGKTRPKTLLYDLKDLL